MTSIAILFGALSIATAPVQAVDDDVDCSNPGSTLEMNQCVAAGMEKQEAALKAYLNIAYAKLRGEGRNDAEEVIAAIQSNQREWETYSKSACSAVWDYWAEGTIRNYMAGKCQADLTYERMHHIWREYLMGNEGDPTLYPEPPREGSAY